MSSALQIRQAPASRAGLFQRFAEEVQEGIGVRLHDGKRLMVEARLRRRWQELGLADLDAYLAYLFVEGAIEDERDLIYDAITTNKTDFFREPDHFTHLCRESLPRAIQRRGDFGKVRMWSAAASTGAEAWTMAICAALVAEHRGPFDWSVIGTDINTEVLETARRAVYPDAFVEPVPADLRERWFLKGQGAMAGQMRVVPALRARVRFHRLNLLELPLPLEDGIDIVFLRNVLIYFSPEDQRRAIHAVHSRMIPGGILYLGQSEAMVCRDEGFRQIAPATFVKES